MATPMDTSLALRTMQNPRVLAGVLVMLAVYSVRWLFFPGARAAHHVKVENCPEVGKAGEQEFSMALEEGYTKYKDSTFVIPTAHHPMVIVPPRFLDEIKALPETILSFQKQVSARFLGKYTGLGVTDTLVTSVKVDLTKNIPRILNDLQDEVAYSVSRNVGDLPEWKALPLYYTLQNLVALLSGRIFVGHPLSRNEAWLHASLSYTLDGFVGAEKLWKYPRIFHPIMRFFIPEIQAVNKYLSDGARLLGPTIRERTKARQKDRNYEKPSDMIQWIIDNSDEKNRDDVAYVTKTQMFISVVAIHTTTMTMAQAIFDLVSHPEYFEPLREELRQIRAEHGYTWSRASIAKLRKMDSFMKESQRFRPPGLVTMNRQVEQEIKLSNGIVLPIGVHIGVAAGANATDSTLVERASEFDGFRFERIRAQPGNDNKYQFVTTGNADQLHWGVGTHACPGRFFASYEIKMLIAQLLENYDFKLENGVERPEDIKVDIRVVPNPMAKVLFRNRKV